jgi:uncharacterized protein (DUF488 family)
METPTARRIGTIGYGGRSPSELIAALQAHGVHLVADVRLRPDRASMGYYAKAKTPDKGIERILNEAGIAYVSLPELGNPFMDFLDWRERYALLLERAGDLLTARLVDLPQPFCLLCAERRPAECHRSLIADYLAARGAVVQHIE